MYTSYDSGNLFNFKCLVLTTNPISTAEHFSSYFSFLVFESRFLPPNTHTPWSTNYYIFKLHQLTDTQTHIHTQNLAFHEKNKCLKIHQITVIPTYNCVKLTSNFSNSLVVSAFSKKLRIIYSSCHFGNEKQFKDLM